MADEYHYLLRRILNKVIANYPAAPHSLVTDHIYLAVSYTIGQKDSPGFSPIWCLASATGRNLLSATLIVGDWNGHNDNC